MKQVIVGHPEGEVQVKRFYMNCPTIVVECPGCGSKLAYDFDEQYLSYPEIGVKEHIGFYCDKCSEADAECVEYTVPVLIKDISVTLEYDPDEVKPEL